MSLPPSLLSSGSRQRLHRVLLLCGWVCLGNLWLARFLHPEPDAAGVQAVLAILLALPWIQHKLAERTSTRRGWRLWRTAAVFGLQVWLGTTLPFGGIADGLLVLSTWLAMHLVVRPSQTGAAALLVGITPLQTMAAMGTAPSPVWLLGLPLALVLSSLAAVLLSNRYHLERVQARAARVHLRSWLQSPTADAKESTPYAAAIALSLVVLFATALAYPAMVALPRPFFNPRSPSLSGQSGSNAADQERNEEDANATGGANGDGFPGDLRPGGGLGNLTYENVMTIQAFARGALESPRDVGPLYIRALCLDTFTETGLRTSQDRRLASIADAEDGRADNWIELNESGQDLGIQLRIRHNILRVRGTGTSVLFAPRPIQSLRLAEAQYNSDYMLALPDQLNLAEVEFALIPGVQPLARAERLGIANKNLVCSHPDARFLQLPQENDDTRWLRGLARNWTSSAQTDYGRVEQIVGRLRGDFDYTTKTEDVPGTQGIAQFMRRKSGHCTSFAAAAVFLLRSQEIPARVATGFLADEYESESQRYNISRKNGHAWIEVHFDGLGWQRFDPTPSLARAAALRAAEAGDDDGLPDWVRGFAGDLAAWARSGADEAYFAQVVETLMDAPRALAASISRQPIWGASLVLLACIAIAWIMRRSRGGVGTRKGRSVRTQPIYRRWLDATQKRFGPRQYSQTLLEWTDSIELDGGSDSELLREIVNLFNRTRFGGQELTVDEEQLVANWISKIQGSPDPNRAT